jgi:hypothetical protein
MGLVFFCFFVRPFIHQQKKHAQNHLYTFIFIHIYIDHVGLLFFKNAKATDNKINLTNFFMVISYRITIRIYALKIFLIFCNYIQS